VVKSFSDQTRVVRIEKETAGTVTGADVITDDQVEVINKDHVIATITDDVPFLLEMVVENGRGYVPSTEHTPQAQEIGIIPVDAAFSPVLRVRYDVEETRVGQKTNYDKLTMEIWTNGSDPAMESKLSMSLAELDLSVRATNCLESENITTVRELVVLTEDHLLDVRNFGETTLVEVRDRLAEIGLSLGMRVPPAPISPL